MIHRVWERCCLALPKQLVYVATDDCEIAKHCEYFGIQVIMTPDTCLTGTDRVYEASKQVDAETYINVQGDEPLIDPEDIKKVLESSSIHPDDIINGMCFIKNEKDFYSSAVPKVVTRPDGRLLYMSRAPIPTNKNLGFMLAKKQVCIYAFPKKILEEFAKVKAKTSLEQIEDIEILRFLELGYEVKMVEVSSSSVAIDFPADVMRVETILNEKY
jgi:3-deoxy-manno-octulosonate cytidylyltransferase (CMP-KDO synthetase)